MNGSAVDRLIATYPRIYFACHTRHVRDPATGTRMSAHQAGILSHLDDVEPTSVSELAEHMGVTVSTMSISVGRLGRQGYVDRRRSAADGRVVELRLTEAGRRVRDAQSVLDPELVKDLLERLPPGDRSRALDGLTLLGRAADDMIREAAGSSFSQNRTRADAGGGS
jgi:DNA-binding MarR family transcriptional regulator